jgi:general secretion pathway protein L
MLVPSEQVLLLAVAMPAMPSAQRRAAVAFAVEDRIAAPLDDVHVVLGPALPSSSPAQGGQYWLVAVVAQAVLAALPPGRKLRLLPDVLALPVPQTGQWSVWTQGLRVLVRTGDGAGFATDTAALPYFHLAAGHPGIVLYGGQLDPQVSVLTHAVLPDGPDPALLRFDLNQGRAPTGGFGQAGLWRRLAAVAVIAAVAHLALGVADLWALGRIRAAHQATVQAQLLAMGQPAAADNLEAAIATVMAQADGPETRHFVPLAARAFAAIMPEQGRVTAAELRFAADQNSLALQLQAPDIATLQKVESTLIRAGFGVAAGAATTRDGLAEQQLTLTGGAP